MEIRKQSIYLQINLLINIIRYEQIYFYGGSRCQSGVRNDHYDGRFSGSRKPQQSGGSFIKN